MAFDPDTEFDGGQEEKDASGVPPFGMSVSCKIKSDREYQFITHTYFLN